MVNSLRHQSLQWWCVHDGHHHIFIGMTERILPNQEFAWQGEDLIASSLMKNPGGTIVPCGGYVARKKDLVTAAGGTPDHVMLAVFQGLILGFLLRKFL